MVRGTAAACFPAPIVAPSAYKGGATTRKQRRKSVGVVARPALGGAAAVVYHVSAPLRIAVESGRARAPAEALRVAFFALAGPGLVRRGRALSHANPAEDCVLALSVASVTAGASRRATALAFGVAVDARADGVAVRSRADKGASRARIDAVGGVPESAACFAGRNRRTWGDTAGVAAR